MDLDNIHWLGHSSVKINGDVVLYVDPYHIPKGEMADIIMITHEHYDHLSLEDIQKIKNDQTVLIVPKKNEGQFIGEVIGVKPGDDLEVKGVQIHVVSAYNINKSFHPKDRNYVGYVFTIEDYTFYHAGDTDVIPEMKSIKADVIFLPVSGTYTMNAQEAAEAAEIIRPKLAIPIHWGSVAGYRTDADLFNRLSLVRSMIFEQETE